MDVQADAGADGVLDRVQQQLEANGETGYTLNNYVMADVTFYVNGEKQVPQQPITFTVKGTNLDSQKTVAFSDDRQNNPTFPDVTEVTAEDGSKALQFTAETTSETVVYGVAEKTEAEVTEQNTEDANVIAEPEHIAYEQTYSDDQVEIKVTAEAGILPNDAQLSVTPIVKTDITDNMSAEEKQAAEAINAKYDSTEQKLNEKADSEAYDIAGFLAYDISFTDKDGNKVEPTGDVNVSMNYKQAAIPETVQKVMQENPDNTTMDVTVMHLEEDEKGEVQNVVDMVADANEKANVETTDAQSVEKAEFVSDSFSVFSLSWKNEYSINVKTVDTNGNEIGTGSQTVTITEATAWDDIAPTIDGYIYNKAALGSKDGTEMYQVRIGQGNGDHSQWLYWQYNQTDTPENWTDFENNQTIYLVYQKALVKITDDIVNTGALRAEYQAEAGNNATVTSYIWYRSDAKNGEYAQVEKVNYQASTIKSNLSDDGTQLYPAYDDGARKWYKVKAVLSDGTEKESAPFQVSYYNQLQNGSFEILTVTGGYNNQWSNAYYAANGGVWQTTGTNNGRDIEIVKKNASGGASAYSWWRNSSTTLGRDNHSWKDAAYDGDQFAELNCEAAGALYQDVLTREGTPLNYWFAHRARGNNANQKQYDTMYLVIMPKSVAEANNLTTQDNLTAYLQTTVGNNFDSNTEYKTEGSEQIYNQNGVMVLRVTSSNQSWQYINQIAGYTATSSVTRFFFMSGNTASKDNTVGNFLDQVGFSQDLPPVADDEFSLQIKKDFVGLGNADITAVKKNLTFKISATRKNDGTELSDEEVTALFGKSTISGSEMTQQLDGSLVYTIANKKIGINDSYKVTITEENAELTGYTLSKTAQTSVQTKGSEDVTTTENAEIAELKAKVTATVSFTNTYEADNFKNINFTKVWDDADNKYNTRPESLDVTLHATYTVSENGTTQAKDLDLTNLVTPGATVTLNSATGWKCSWKVPVYYKLSNGTNVKINYYITEGENSSEYVYTAVTDDGKALSGNGTEYTKQFTELTNEMQSSDSNTSTQSTSKKNVLSKMRTALASLFAKNSDNTVAVTSDTDSSTSAGLGEPAHNKSVTYNADEGDYTLNLDVTGAKGSASGVDVLFVIDRSGSMGGYNSTLLSQVQSLLTKNDGIVDKIFAKSGNKNSVAMVSFSGKAGTSTTAWYGGSSKTTFKSKVNGLTASGGTNWTYAMVKAKELLDQKSNSGNEKVVIFMSDGKPTYSWNGWKETGNGSDTKTSYYQDAADQVTGSLGSAKMYSVYLTSGTQSGMKTFSDKLTNSDLVDGTNLTSALTNILNKVIPTYKNVTITDTLSEYVDFAETNPTITVTKKTADNKVTTLAASDFSASINGKTITVGLLNGNSLEDGSTYTVSFRIKPSEAANNYYAEHKNYPHTGDAGTGITSADKKGFYSNDSSATKLKYKIDGTDDGLQTASYNKPVVQVTTHVLTYEKVWNQPEGVSHPEKDVVLNVTYTDGTTATVTLTKDADYRYQETVPVTKNIAQVTETAVEDYEPSYSITDNGTKVVVTNNYQKVTARNITVKKVWNGNGPKSAIKVSLYRNVNGSDATLYDTVTLSDANKWQHIWSNLPQYEGSSTEQKTYSYVVREESIPTNYQSDIQYEYGDDAITATITNTYDPNCADENYYIANVLQTEQLHINKMWNDNNDKENLRPSKLAVTVDGKTYTLKASENWTKTVTILKKKTTINSAEETLENDNYIQDGNAEISSAVDGVDVTFTNKLNMKSIKVAKVWNDGNVKDRPTSIKFQLNYRKSKNDAWTKYDEYTITEEDMDAAGNSWTTVISNLPTAYEYQVVELTGSTNTDSVTTETSGNAVDYSNYISKVTSNGDDYTITNTLKWYAVKTSASWDETDTSEGVGLKGAEFELRQDNNVIATGRSEDGGKIIWTLTSDAANAKVDLDNLTGTYSIRETKAPEGYVKNTEEWTVTFEKGLLIKLNNKAVTGSAEQGVVIKLTNKKVYALPHTGGPGIYLFTIGGILLMGAAAWILYKNKCREVLKR